MIISSSDDLVDSYTTPTTYRGYLNSLFLNWLRFRKKPHRLLSGDFVALLILSRLAPHVPTQLCACGVTGRANGHSFAFVQKEGGRVAEPSSICATPVVAFLPVAGKATKTF